jgi:hypothetical protein
MRFNFWQALVIALGLGFLPLTPIVDTAAAEEPKTCSDGKPCPTDAELEDSCTDEQTTL